VGKKEDLKNLKKLFGEMSTKLNFMGNNTKVSELGKARDRAGKDVQRAQARVTKATTAAATALRDLKIALDADTKATEAYQADMENEGLEKAFYAAAATTKAAQDSQKAADKELVDAQAELDRFADILRALDKEDEDNFMEMQAFRKEMDRVQLAANKLQKEIEFDDANSMSAKFKKLFA
jgi:hypothetical protein